MLVDEMRARLKDAMRAGDTRAKSILRVALGDVESATLRRTEALGDEDVLAILRKLVKSNRESLAVARDDAQRQVLEEEIGILEALLPQTLDLEAIREALAPVSDAVCAAKSDGQATGIAMKHLKGIGAEVEGATVARAVAAMRA